jgi:hypothetical protein
MVGLFLFFFLRDNKMASKESFSFWEVPAEEEQAYSVVQS